MVKELNNKKTPDVSIVVACYNEVKRGNPVEQNIEELIEVMKKSPYSFEILLFDDCSKDNTKKVLERIAKKHKNVFVLGHAVNQGRGKTVSDGLKKVKGKMSGFIDIDLSTAASYIPVLLREIENGADIASAWRIEKMELAGILRIILSVGYHRLVNFLLKVDLKDTEAGCKFFKTKKILPILEEVKEKHWFWDTEIMVLPYYKGYKIVEVPTVFLRKGEINSTLKPFSDTMYYLKKIFAFRKKLKQKGILK